MRSAVRRKIDRQQRTMFLLFFVVPLTFLLLVAHSAIAMGFGVWPTPPASATVDMDLPFEDVTEQMEFDYPIVRNPTDSLVTCMVGKAPIWIKKATSPDPSGRWNRRGYRQQKREYIKFQGTVGFYIFKVDPQGERRLTQNLVSQIGTMQCAKVDKILASRCRPGQNIHKCLSEQGL